MYKFVIIRENFNYQNVTTFSEFILVKTAKTNLPTHGVKPKSDDCPGGQWLCSPEIRQFYDCMCVVVLILHASVKKVIVRREKIICVYMLFSSNHHFISNHFLVLHVNIYELTTNPL